MNHNPRWDLALCLSMVAASLAACVAGGAALAAHIYERLHQPEET